MKKTIQGLSLLLFAVLFLLADYRLPEWLPADFYLRIDPLLGLNAVIASREIIPRVLWSLLLVGATVAFGRFFCAYVCPLGACIDGCDYLLFRRKKRPGLPAAAGLRRWKYALLIAILVAASAGVSLVYLLDPIAFLTRFFTFVLHPLAVAIVNFFLDLLRPLARGMGLVSLSYRHYPQPVYYMTAVTLILFAAIVALGRWAPRFWCRAFCPLGALLSLLSPLGLFKRRVSDACTRCGACQQACPMDAIGDDPLQTRAPECIQCRQCARICPPRAISFPASFSGVGQYPRLALSRRGFFASLAGGAACGFVALHSPFTLLQGKRPLIRPPGALPEKEFLRTCIRCGECMKSCVTNTLQPCFWESGLTGLWTPKLELRMAACEPNCHVCGRVCPTQAIRSLTLEEKNHAKIGTAVLRKEQCLVWSQNKLCLICDEICPYNAIVFRPVEGYRRPVVVPSRCNGCGYCEQQCPVQGESAIVVVADGEIRLEEGSYMAEARQRQLDFKPDPGDDRFLIRESGLEIGGQDRQKEQGTPADEPGTGKPKGFL